MTFLDELEDWMKQNNANQSQTAEVIGVSREALSL